MEDIINISPLIKNNSYANFSGLNTTSNYSMRENVKNKEKLKIKEEKIKMLNEQLKAYKKINLNQSNQLSENDNILIDFNSLQKNYSELELEYNKIKHENNQLKEAVAAKNLMINEFIKGFEISSNKFQKFNDKNTNLKLKNEEYESKLKIYPSLLKKNEELNLKINDYENKMNNIKEEHIKKIELYKIKYENYEKNQKHKIRQYEEEIEELKNEIETIKTKLENSKKINDDLSEKIVEQTNAFEKKENNKQKQNDNLQNSIIQLKEKISETEIKYENENIQNKKLIDKLEEDIKNLNFDLEDREKQIVLLNEALIEFDISNRSAENELKKRESLIINLSEEKERLQRQFNDKQMDFVEFQNSTQHIIDILHKKLLSIDKEKNYLFDNQNSNINEINLLQEQLNQYKLSNNDNFEECNKIDKQYNDLYKAFQIKDNEFNEKSNQLKSVIQKRNTDKEKIKIKYESEIQKLISSNNELNSIISKLINTLIEVKDNAMSIERGINEANDLNNSIYSTQGLTTTNNCYTTNRNSNKYNEELIKEIKNMIEKIDYNIMNNNG
jgi:chromosome segregation ATPase